MSEKAISTRQNPAKRRSRPIGPVLVGAVLSLVTAVVPAAADMPTAAGHWVGRINAPGQAIDITVDLGSEASGWRGVIDIPAQKLRDFPLTNIEIDGESVSFAMPGVPGDPVFRAKLKKKGSQISGRLHQGGAVMPFVLKADGEAQLPAVVPPPRVAPELASAVDGTWQGTMRTPGGLMKMALHVVADPDGTLTATVDSLSQNQVGLPVSRLSVRPDRLRAELSYAGAVLEGKLDSGEGTLTGDWKQLGQSFSLNLKKDASSEPTASSGPQASRNQDPFPTAEASAVGLDPQALDRLASHVESLVDREQVVGAELLVIKNRRTVLRQAYGFKDRETSQKLEPGAVFCVRSMTKPLVGTAIQMLIDEGELSLDTPIHKILPAFDTAELRPITVDHLLTHTAGFPLTTMNRPLSSYKKLSDVAREAAERDLDFTPGARFQYSDAGSDSLGAVVAAITGAPVEEFIAARILKPLGMDDSHPLLEEGAAVMERVASAYSGGTGSWIRHWKPTDGPLFPLFLTSQGLYSTTSDYARFLALWMDDGRVGSTRLLSEDAVRRGLEPVSSMQGYPASFDGLGTSYGRQWVVYADAESVFPTVFGHDGSDGTHAWAWPEEDLMVLYFTQSRGSIAGLEVGRQAQRLLVDGLLDDEPTTTVDLAALEGLYWDETAESAYYVVKAVDGRLSVERPGRMHWHFKPGQVEGRFDHEALPDTWIEFVRGDDGAVDAMRTSFGGRIELDPRHQPAADLPSVDAVVTKLLAAHGTGEPMSDGIRVKGTLSIPSRNMQGKLETVFDATRHRTEIRFEPAESGLREVVVNDGKKVRIERSGAPGDEPEGARLEQAMLDRFPVRFGDWRRHYAELEVLKRVRKGERSVLLLRAVPHQAPGMTFIVDENSGRLMITDTLVQIPGLGTVGVRTHYDDYKKIGALTLPTRAVSKYATPLIGKIDVHFTEWESGVELDAELFVP